MIAPAVYLIGTGPGAPDLITVRGLRCLQLADVVIYDHLVHPRLLQDARPEAERIDVGNPAVSGTGHEAICYLLAEKAREGRTVARLKRGDPFVFDDSSSEALFLHEQGIAFEVVPGLPPAIGVPAYAGIPVTWPGAGNTLTLVRGQEASAHDPHRVDWAALARLEGTLVYAGTRSSFRVAASALIRHGRAGAEAAAVIANGTTPAQHTIICTLDGLADATEDDTVDGPALLVVGAPLSLREHLRWYDARPLFGRRVLVTRSREQGRELAMLLEAAGAEAVEAPLIAIHPPADHGPLDEACLHADRYDWIVFTSVNGAHAFFTRLLTGPRDVRALGTARLCAVGPGTAGRLTQIGLKVDLLPEEHSGEGVAAALASTGSLRGSRILFPKADIARDIVPERLRAAGAIVDEVVAYRTVRVEPDEQLDIYRQLLDRRIDVVTFSSASAVHAFAETFGPDQSIDLLAHTDVATIGPVTAEAANRYGFRPSIVPAMPSMRGLVDAIAAHTRRVPVAAGTR